MERALRKYCSRWEGRECIFYRWPEHRKWKVTERCGIVKLQKTVYGHAVWLQVQAFAFGVNELTQQGKYKAVCSGSTYGKDFRKESNITRRKGCTKDKGLVK